MPKKKRILTEEGVIVQKAKELEYFAAEALEYKEALESAKKKENPSKAALN